MLEQNNGPELTPEVIKIIKKLESLEDRSDEQLAELTGLPLRTIFRILKQLTKSKWTENRHIDGCDVNRIVHRLTEAGKHIAARCPKPQQPVKTSLWRKFWRQLQTPSGRH